MTERIPSKSGNADDAAATEQCGLCGSSTNLIRTPCCGNWICNDESEYKLFSFERNSCFRNHSRFTLCGAHFAAGHEGDWKDCEQCREDNMNTEMYVYFGTNEYNFEVLPNPPEFEPTHCSDCGRVINLGQEGFTLVPGKKYVCSDCMDEPIPDFRKARDAAEPDAEEIIEDVMLDLDLGFDELPVEAIRTIQADRETYIPRLIECLKEATELVASGSAPSGKAHFFAYYLLTEFQVHEAWPAIRAAFALPGEGPFDLFGDMVTEDTARSFAVFLAGRPDELDEIALDCNINEYVRWQACHAYMYWVRDGRMAREEAIQRLKQLLLTAIETRDMTLATGVVGDLYDFGPAEVMKEIRKAYELRIVDEGFIDRDQFQESTDKGEAHFKWELEQCPPTGFEDTVDHLKDWYCFKHENTNRSDSYEKDFLDTGPPSPEFNAASWENAYVSEPIYNESPKVGRNEPCPCGSGKKYKKCCGKS
ncbi:MAG: DUF1186 domain-containing protein [Planctomycetaceae bacterium]